MKISKTKRKYEIISISHYFPPRVGGVEVMAKNLLKGLSGKNLKCLAIYSSKHSYWLVTVFPHFTTPFSWCFPPNLFFSSYSDRKSVV